MGGKIILKEITKLFSVKTTYLIVAILLILVTVPIILFHKQVRFDPIAFMNNYYSVIMASVLITIFMQIGNYLWGVMSKVSDVDNDIESLDEIIKELKFNIDNYKLDGLQRICSRFEHYCRRVRKSKLKAPEIRLIVKADERVDAIKYVRSKLKSVIRSNKITELDKQSLNKKFG